MKDKNLQEIKELCALIGSDPLLVQGPGGNASLKERETIWIKASGSWLADAERKDIFLPIRRTSEVFEAISNDRPYEFESLNPKFGRPSIETVLHCLLDHRFTLHVHAINPLALLVREDAKPELAKRLSGEVPYIFIPYAKPGHQLARMVVSAMDNLRSSCRLLLLANHGIVIVGETINEIIATLHRVCDLCKPVDIHRPALKRTPLSSLKINDTIYDPVNERHLHALAIDHHLFSLVKRHWALYPDHVVFLGPRPLIFESVEQATCSQTLDYAPFIFIEDSGVWQMPDVTLAALAQLQCYYDVLIRLDKQCRLVNLTEQQIGELLDWDAEKHRQGLNQ